MNFVVLENPDAGINVHPKLKEFIFQLNSEPGVSSGFVVPRHSTQIRFVRPFITETTLKIILEKCGDNYGVFIDEEGLIIYLRGDKND